MLVSYARVSKDDQNLDRQIDALIEYGVDKRNIYQEKVTGTKKDREQLQKMISERTKEGLRSARARGRNGGRPKKSIKDVERAIKLYDSKQYTLKEIEEMTGVSKATLYRNLSGGE